MVSIHIHDRHGHRVLDQGAEGSQGTVGTAYGGRPRHAPRPQKPPGVKAGGFTVDNPPPMAQGGGQQPGQKPVLPGTHQAAAQQHEALAAHHQGLNYGAQNPVSRAHSEAAKAHKAAHGLLGKPGYQQAANWANSATEHAGRLSKPPQDAALPPQGVRQGPQQAGPDIKAGSNQQQPPRPAPQPYRGYDSGTTIGAKRAHSTRRHLKAEDEAKKRRSWLDNWFGTTKPVAYSDHRTIDEWFHDAFDPTAHPRGGDPAHTGRFSKGSGGAGGGAETKSGEGEKPGGKRATNIQAKPGTRAPGRGAQQKPEGEKAEGEKKSKATKADSPAKSAYDEQEKIPTKDEFYDTANGFIDQETANAIAENKEKLKEGYQGQADTQRVHKPGGTLEGRPGHEVYKGGAYTDTRKEKHKQVMRKLFSRAKKKAATPPAGTPPTFVMLGGRGGSGKSFFTDGDKKRGGTQDPVVDKNSHILIDSDWFKKELGSEGWDAALYHEEASDLVDAALAYAQKRGLNVIFDATMKSMGSADRNLSAFEGAGFQTKGYYMHTPVARAASNAMERYRGEKNDFGGRFVPPEYILESTTNEETFDALRHRFGDWGVYVNKTGKDPRPYASKSNPD